MEFSIWLLALATGNLFFTVPTYLVTSFIMNRIVKDKQGITLKLVTINFGIMIIVLLLFDSFTIANTTTILVEILVLNWIGKTLYFDSKTIEKGA